MGERSRRGDGPDFAVLGEVVAAPVLEAMRAASAQLDRSGIRHALVGGIAVGLYGYVRNTKVVDFLVGDEAFAHHAGGIVTVAPGVPIQVGTVAVDPLSIGPGERHLEEAIRSPARVDGIPLAPVEALIYLKLKSPRRKDAADVVELLKAEVDAKKVRAYLALYAVALLPKFEGLAADAEREESEVRRPPPAPANC